LQNYVVLNLCCVEVLSERYSEYLSSLGGLERDREELVQERSELEWRACLDGNGVD
jgi:hypothetical protein